ncbi:hypothetical protein BASA81_003241 [Batrachochytrium salamandrivorans]|nr:hypothetical protein BASA81_003241 [Batrachochytrium salamandrivorans]
MNLSFCELDPMVRRGKLLALQRPQANIDFTVGYVVFGFLFNFACLGLWLWFKPQYERTRVRPTMFVVLAVLCSLCQMSYGSIMSIFSATYPCFLGPLLLVMSIPFAATSVIGRLILYAFLSGFSSAVSNNLKNREDTGSISPTNAEVMSTSTTEEGSRFLTALVTCWLIVKRIMYPTGRINSERELYVLKFLLTNRGILTMALFFSTPIFIVILAYLFNSASEQVYKYCSTCAISTEISTLTVVFLVLFWAMGVLDWLLLTWEKKKAQRAAAAAGLSSTAGEDYWGLKTEAFAGLLSSLVTILGFILTTFDYSKIYPYSHLFMLSLGLWMLVASQTILQIYLARRTERTLFRQTTDSVTKIDNIMLLQVLQDPTLCQLFEQHLVAEFAVESLYFLKDVAQWENSYYNIAATARTARARKIYKSYIAITGLYSVNVSSEVNQEIRLRGGEGNPIAVEDVPVDLFQKAKVEISHMLITGALLRFYQAKMKHASPLSSPTSAKIEDLSPRKPPGQDAPTASRLTALVSRASS